MGIFMEVSEQAKKLLLGYACSNCLYHLLELKLIDNKVQKYAVHYCKKHHSELICIDNICQDYLEGFEWRELK